MKKILFIMLSLIGYLCSAQTNIGGIELLKQYSNQEIKNILGKDPVISQEEGEDGIYDVYKYGEDVFVFYENILYSVELKTQKYKVDGDFGVGSNVKGLYNSNKPLRIGKSSVNRVYYYDPNDAYGIILYCNNSDNITSISMYTPY